MEYPDQEEKNFFLLNRLRTAAEIWGEIEHSPIPADKWLGNYFHRYRKKIGSKDRRFFAETIYSALRHKLYYTALLGLLKPAASDIIVLLASYREGLISDSEFPELLTYATSSNVDPKLLARWIKTHELPARLVFSSDVEKMSVLFSFPVWLIQRWQKQWNEKKLQKLLQALLEKAPLIIRTNLIKINRETLLDRLSTAGCSVHASPETSSGIIFDEKENVFDTQEFRDGWFEVQDDGSQMVCEIIQPKPGETLWDVCAGGGGKSLALAAMMQNKGRVVATDIRALKLEELKKRAKRNGIYNIFPADIKRMAELRTAQKGFDKILVDAPCSGTGTLRRNPDAKWKLKPDNFSRLHKTQVEIIEKSLPYLRTNGVLYYSTCSLDKEENEDVAEEILSKHPQLKKFPVAKTEDGYLQLSPDTSKTDGFFLAAFTKTGS